MDKKRVSKEHTRPDSAAPRRPAANVKRITIHSAPPGEQNPRWVGIPDDFTGPGAAVSMLSTRSRLVSRPKLVDGPEGLAVLPGKAPNVFLLVFAEGSSVVEDFDLEFEFLGEPPSPAEVEWSEGERVLASTAGADESSDLGELTEMGKTPEELFAEREAAVEALGGELVQDFFLEYDRGTNLSVGLLPAGLEAPIANLQKVLCQRVLLKARKYDSGVFPKGTAPLDVKKDVQKLATMQLELYIKHFGDLGDPANFQALGEAFENFARGKLRLSDDQVHLNAEPDSSWFFFFAEFMLLAAEFVAVEAERGFWLELCKVLAWLQEAYVECYPFAGTAKARFVDYDPWNFVGSDVSTAVVDAWAATYQSATLEELHELTARNASEAFPGEHDETEFPC